MQYAEARAEHLSLPPRQHRLRCLNDQGLRASRLQFVLEVHIWVVVHSGASSRCSLELVPLTRCSVWLRMETTVVSTCLLVTYTAIGYSKIGLKSTAIASTFGKVFRMKRQAERTC